MVANLKIFISSLFTVKIKLISSQVSRNEKWEKSFYFNEVYIMKGCA